MCWNDGDFKMIAAQTFYGHHAHNGINNGQGRLYAGLTRNFISFHLHSQPTEQVNNLRMVVRTGQHLKLCLRWSSVHKSRESVV